jgi:hypothetical protein
MVVQAYKLAASGLAKEIRKSVNTTSTKSISDLSTALDSCLRELEGLQRTLTMYPAIEDGEMWFFPEYGMQGYEQRC